MAGGRNAAPFKNGPPRGPTAGIARIKMKNVAIECVKCAGVIGALVSALPGCGGASTAQGSEPAKTTAAPAASGSAAPGTATGGAPGPEQINAVLKDHSRELKACYDREKDRGMAYKGDTKFRVKLDPAGKVTDVEGVETTPPAEFLTACVSESMKGWTFPSSPKGGSVTFAVPWK
jgi:outer membrane biosynthesis protein TonB